MKTIKRIAVVMVLLMCSASWVIAAQGENLYSLGKSGIVKVFLGELKDLTEEQKVDMSDLRHTLKEGLTARKSIRFEVVSDKAAADIVIQAEVTEYFWTDHDPTDMLMGLGAIAYDAAVAENYARLQAKLTVTDARSENILWQDKIKTTITDAQMTQVESVQRVNEGIVKEFITECFGKKRDRA